MNKIDYNKKMKEQIQCFTNRPKLLLHSCCGPCSSSVLDKIKKYFDITVIYYNPNIHPKEEYEHRKSEQIRLLQILDIKFLDCDYNPKEYFDFVKGFEEECEGGARCERCFSLRLDYTAKIAKEKGFDFFGTTLTVSPHKNSKIINELGEKIGMKHDIQFLYSDFKKENGYLNSINLSREYNLYRQDYCGCIFSKNNR